MATSSVKAISDTTLASNTTTADNGLSTSLGLVNLNTNLNLANIILIAKFDYSAKEQHELDLKKYERLVLIDNTKNWWLVKKCDSNQTGYVPSNYVKKEKKSIFEKIIPRKLSTTTNSKANSTNAPISSATTDSSKTKTAIVKHKYTAVKIDELTLAVGTRVRILEKYGDGWWKVSMTTEEDGKELIGLYPSNYLQEENTSGVVSNNESLSGSLKTTDTNQSISEKINESLNSSLAQNPSLSRSPKYLFEPTNQNNTSLGNSDLNNTKCESISSNEKEIEYVRVIYPHRARKSCEYSNPIILNELTIEVSEILKLIEDDNECLDYDKSWLKVFNSQGITGLIPSNCVQPILDNQLTEFVFVRRPTTQGIFGNKPWYFGNITRFETIVLLNKFAVNGDYLVRDSDNGNFSISLKSDSLNNKHFKVFFRENRFTIGKKIFYSMDELLSHYHKNPIFDQNGEKLFLIKPFEPPPIAKTCVADCFDI